MEYKGILKEIFLIDEFISERVNLMDTSSRKYSHNKINRILVSY